MKRRILALVAVVMMFAVIIAVSGCSLFGGEEEPPAPDIVLEDLIGTWSRETSQGTETYIFNDNMRYSQNNAGSFSIGTFSISGNELSTTASETNKTRTHVVRFSEDKNTMTWGDGTVKTEYTRAK